MRQKCWFIYSTCFGHQYAHHQESNSEFRFGVQTWKAVWVVKRWVVRCVYCLEDVAQRATSSKQYTHLTAQHYTTTCGHILQAVHTSNSPALHNHMWPHPPSSTHI